MNVENPHPESVALDRTVQLRRELMFHLGLLALALVVLVMSFLMRSAGEHLVYLPGSNLPLPPSCLGQQIFGIECPGCGLTRSFIAISQGRLGRAWYFNPASFVVYLFVALQVPWRVFQIGRILTNRFPVFSGWLFLPIGVAIASLLLQWILKLTKIL